MSAKSKVTEIKELASSAGITAVCGISEPALYGVTMRFRTCLYSTMIGGFFMGMNGVKNYTGGFPGLMTMPGYIGGDGLYDLIFASIGAAIAFAIAFAVSFVTYRDPSPETAPAAAPQSAPANAAMTGAANVRAPLSGDSVPLSQVNDPTFADEILGKGVAIIPDEGLVVSPVGWPMRSIRRTRWASRRRCCPEMRRFSGRTRGILWHSATMPLA